MAITKSAKSLGLAKSLISPLYASPKYKRARKEVDNIVDGLGMGIDPEIKEAVAALRASGVSTAASCAGHSDRGLSYPWIDVGVEYKPPKELPKEKIPGYVQKILETTNEAKNDDVYHFIMIDGKRFNVSKKGSSTTVKSGDLSQPNEEQLVELRRQFQKIVKSLEKYYRKNDISYLDILCLDVRTMTFRIQPAVVDGFGLSFNRLGEHRSEILNFCKFIFENENN